MAQPQQAPHPPVQRPQIALPHAQMPQMPQMQQHQQIPQMSPQLAPRVTYQQAQNSPSPVNTTQPAYGMNPHKRQRVSPGPAPPQNNSQPASPYLPTTNYAMSPQPHNAPSPAAHSPNYGNVASPQSYSAPYTNGNMAPMAAQTLHLPEARPAQPTTPAPLRPATPSPATPALPTPQHQYTMAALAPAVPPQAPSNTGTMGPPSKPAEKPTKEYEYDISDSLAGTGVDLRAEEQALAEYYAGSFLPDARTGLPGNPPGSKDSMYGAGWANQPGPAPDGKTQEEWAAEVAKKAWNDAALRLGHLRTNEVKDPFCQVSVLHYRADKIVKEYGLSLNMDMKAPNAGLGKMRRPEDATEKPTIKVSTKTYDDGAVVMTTGSWMPHDACLADQLALLSIATKYRVRELLEDANVIATTRQTTSHGEVPEEWIDVAVPLKTGVEIHDTPESAVSPRTNPLKRSFEASNEPSFAGKAATYHNLNRDVRKTQESVRQEEEARLKKRQKRLNPENKSGTAKTVATPGTPGGAAPEGELKAPAKKETKKSMKEKNSSAASSTTDANTTVNTFFASSFGKKKSKKYSWMDGGATASGPSTPKPLGGTASAAASPGPVGQTKPPSLTMEQRIKLGYWRENDPMGKGIQLRDWVVVLERDGKDAKAIQAAYDKLDSSGK
ncbi:hypothetical protein V8F06_007432 [Rhypophila decipiens]